VALTIVKKRKKTHKRNLGVFLKEIFRKRNMRNILEYSGIFCFQNGMFKNNNFQQICDGAV
jgi:hypothetical protein